MNKYQLFSTLPEPKILNDLEEIFPIKGFREKIVQFSKYDFEKDKCLDKLKNFIPELQKYYLPCKQKTFLNCLNFKKSLTILRQILRIFGFKLKHKEKFIRYKKFYIYWIVYDKELVDKDTEKFNRSKNYILFFD